MHTWDNNVALAFAAEELLFAAQAITSDSISQELGFGMAHSHVHILSEHRRALPSDIAERIEVLDATYTDRENCGDTEIASAKALIASTLTLLRTVQERLLEAQRTKARAA